MANRKTALDWTTCNIFGVDYLTDADSIQWSLENKTAEGKGIAEIDDWPVLTGRGNTVTLNIQVPYTGTVALIGTAFSSSPAGAVTLNGGVGKSYAGTAVLTSYGHNTDREGIQVMPITLKFRGSVTVS